MQLETKCGVHHSAYRLPPSAWQRVRSVVSVDKFTDLL